MSICTSNLDLLTDMKGSNTYMIHFHLHLPLSEDLNVMAMGGGTSSG